MQKLKELLPNVNPRQAMSDFQSNSGKAVRFSWPQIEIGAVHSTIHIACTGKFENKTWGNSTVQ